MREIIFDTETTGLSAKDGDRIIEIGAIEMIDRFPTGQTFHEYLHPGDRPIHPDAQRVHGISMEQLKDKPSFDLIWEKFDAFFGEGVLIAHNAPFDIGFFNAELKRLNKPAIDPDRVVDTLAIAKRKFPGARNNLDALCDRFGISNGHRTLHGALLDSELLADVYIELTGGRQAGLNLEQNNENKGAEGYALSTHQQSQQTMRPEPLGSRLTQVEKQAHEQMIDGIENAIWKKWV